jgi:SHS family sialic acid transporter-like MFS transporter
MLVECFAATRLWRDDGRAECGILLLSQLARQWSITPGLLALGVSVCRCAGAAWPLRARCLAGIAEVAGQSRVSKGNAAPLRELFQPQLIRFTLMGILLSAIPMVGAWSASKWMIPWADKVAGASNVGYKAATQGWWALGATHWQFRRGAVRQLDGTRWSYAFISAATVVITIAMFQMTAPLRPGFMPLCSRRAWWRRCFSAGLRLYLPELFPTRVRATGSGLAYNSGRFATAFGVLGAGFLFAALGGDYPRVGTLCAMIYALGFVVIWWAPDTKAEDLS